MMSAKKTISTDRAPQAIGAYSQAVRVGDSVYISGQIPLSPDTQEVISGGFRQHACQVFDNLSAIAEAAGGTLEDVVKLTVFLVDLQNFPTVNEVMGEYFDEPYPARAAIGVASLPKGVGIEVEAIMALSV